MGVLVVLRGRDISGDISPHNLWDRVAGWAKGPGITRVRRRCSGLEEWATWRASAKLRIGRVEMESRWEGHMASERVHRAPNTQPALVQHVRVDHGRPNIRMTEQLLHGPDVRAGLQQMRRKAVTQ